MATSYKCEALLSGLLTQQILPTFRENSCVVDVSSFLFFWGFTLESHFLLQGTLHHTQKMLWFEIAILPFQGYVVQSVSAVQILLHARKRFIMFTIGIPTYSHSRRTRYEILVFFTFLTRYDTVKDKENQQEQAHSKIIGNYNTRRWWFPRLLFFVLEHVYMTWWEFPEFRQPCIHRKVNFEWRPQIWLFKKKGNIYRNLEWCLSKNNNLSKIDAIPQKHVPCSFKHVQFQPLQSRWYSSSEN